MGNIKYGLLHCHSENSCKDSAMGVAELVGRAKELGAPAIALTDHGSMTGYIDFMKECHAAGIKPIVGVEAYVEENDEGRRHLILMAKDYEGYKALIKAVSESNKRVTRVRTLAFPRMNREIITECFGKDAPGHGHVIATSACVNGVLAGLMLMGEKAAETLEKLKEKQDRYESPYSESYIENGERFKLLGKRKKELADEARELKKAAAKPTVKLERNVLKAAEGTDAWLAAKEIFERTLAEKSEASARLDEVQKEQEEVKEELSLLGPVVRKARERAARWLSYQEQIGAILNAKSDREETKKQAREEALWYKETFGEGCFYIELQNHGLESEKETMPYLAELSTELGIPACLANDAHMAEKTGDNILARAIMRATMFDKWQDPTKADKELYIKDDDELIEAVSRIIPKEKALEGYENIGKIVSACNLVMPDEEHYPKYTTPDGSTPEECLRKMAYEGINRRYPEGLGEEGHARLEHELDVICSMGYADYHLIVEDFLRYARAAGRLDLSDPEQEQLALSFDVERIEEYVEGMPGETVGPGRGSAAGSLVCYLIGITNIDPLKFGLLFERFLNPERVSMPDIDCDIETKVRPYVIKYVRHKYGEDSVCGIMTVSRLSGKAAIQTAGRVYGLRTRDDTTAYADLAARMSKRAGELSENELQVSLEAVEEGLRAEYCENEPALEILRYALLIENRADHIGQHAAGIIITDGRPVQEYVPLIWNPKNQIMMTQCDMVQAEEIHLLKMDFLGLNNLTVITETLRTIKKRLNRTIDMDEIPLDDEKVYKEIFASGTTDSVFQFESDGMKKMLKSFKPDSIFDLTLLVAMYRPGPLQFLGDVIEVKNGRKKAEFLTPELKPILGGTYGSITYQEQVQEIFKSLAGYSLGQADLVRRAMSKKKEKVLKAERESFVNGDPERGIAGCGANGISAAAANRLFDEMMEFAKYAFNKSHAACYAVVAYQTAWLKLHFPKEYMAAVLNNSKFDKVPALVEGLKAFNIKTEAPDVNRSEMGFTVTDGGILFGLGSIKGLGESVGGVLEERRLHGGFSDIQDFIIRTGCNKKILEGFNDAGAFDHCSPNRAANALVMPVYLDCIKKCREYKKKLAEQYDRKKMDRYQAKYDEWLEKARSTQPDPDVCEDRMERFAREKAVLGVYASGHPMDIYPPPSQTGTSTVKAVSEKPSRHAATMGIVSELKVRATKDNREMAFFTISDAGAGMDAVAFPEAYADAKDLLSEGAALKIEGHTKEWNGRVQFYVEGCSGLRPRLKEVIVYSDKTKFDGTIQNMIKPYVAKNGYPCKIYDCLMEEFRRFDEPVGPAILKAGNIKAVLHDPWSRK